MKFNINVNQEAMSRIEGLNFRDACVIDWLNGMFASDSDKIINKRLNGYTWISLSHFIEDMPLLQIETSSAGSKLIKRIEKFGLIETKTDKKERKMYAKPTSKMRGLYFTNSKQTLSQVQMESAHVQMDANQYTNNNTLINPIEEEVKVEEVVTLPKNRGTHPVDRLLYLYGKLYKQVYDTTYKADFGRDKKIFNQLLTQYSEIQVSYMLCVYFNWHGMTGSDSKEYNFVTGATFPIPMFKTMINKFEVYARNIMSAPFDDDEKLLLEVIKIASN